MLIELRDATFGYGRTPIICVDHLMLERSRCLGIFGPNGSGKTTLVRGIMGLLTPMSGGISVGSENRTARLGYLPQHRGMDLHWPMTALDAASLALSASSRMGWITRGVRQRIVESMQALGVADLSRQRFARLSGGQQQRILLAGALAAKPDALVLDEPTDGLDVHSGRLLLDVLHAQKAGGLCIVMISHEIEDLLDAADEVALLHPPIKSDEPSTVEMIQPAELGQRLTQLRRAS